MSESPAHLTACLLPSTDRTLISHTKALDPTRPVTFVTNEKYNADLGVSLGVGWPPHCSAHLCLAFSLVLATVNQQWPVQPFSQVVKVTNFLLLLRAVWLLTPRRLC